MEIYDFKGKKIAFVVSKNGCEKCILADKAGVTCKYSDMVLRKAGIPDCVFDRDADKGGYYEKYNENKTK